MEDRGEREPCGWGCQWKTEGSEIGREAVWMGVWMEDGVEREGVWRGVDGGKGGVVAGGQRPCTKHASGLVSNMLRCGLKGLQMRWR